MRQDWTNPGREPTPEQVAAFVDAELDPGTHDAVAAWLSDHPAAAAEAEDWRRLADLWRETAPPDPGPAAWEATRARVAAALRPRPMPVVSPAHARRGRLRPLWAAAALTAAAAALAAVLIRPPAPDEEPFQVVSAGDVNIVRIEADDADGVVVGQQLLGDVELATADDVRVLEVEHHPEDGPLARLDEADVPMIVPEAPGGWEP